MNPGTERLRKKYMDNPPEGMTSDDIRRMSADDLPDMDYFLNEDDLSDDGAGVEVFCHLLIHFYLTYVRQNVFFLLSENMEFPIKQKRGAHQPPR